MHSPFVKVCGLTTQHEVDWAVDLGYDAVGVVVSPKSKRYCRPETAISLANHARGRILSFVVALEYREAADVSKHFDIVQVYEMADIPNLALASDRPPPTPGSFEYYFYDASVGSGVFEQLPAWLADVPGKVVIAGGLNSANVRGVVERFNPFGVDVSSGVEMAPAVKSMQKMAEFIKAAKGLSSDHKG
jgi:phosphoribosylanthranilate isomerase